MPYSSANFPTPAHYEMIMRGRKALNNVSPLISKAKNCGLDCTQFEEGYRYLSDLSDSFMREFFPDQITPPTGTGVVTTPD